MGIQASNLNYEKINELLKKEYGIISEKIEEINRGTANIFKIIAQGKQYILKEFSLKRSIKSILKEINIINFLKERNIKVPNYIKTCNGNFYIQNEDRIIILQEFVDGYTMENNTVDEYNKIIESATILGKITKELMNYTKLGDEGIIEKNFSKNTLENGINKIKQLIHEIKDDNPNKDRIISDLELKLKIAEELYMNFNFDSIKKMTITNAHGDYSIQQLIYNDKLGTTVIDFETAKSLPIVWEIIRSYSYIDKEAKDGCFNVKTLVEYFKEFSKYVKLNEYDLKYAPYLYLLQLIGSVFGYKEYNNDFEQVGLLEFAFFRTKLCKYLYENLEYISTELINNVE